MGCGQFPWVNMNGGSLHTRSFRRIHFLVLGTAFQVSFREALTSDLEGTGMEMNNSRYEHDSQTCTCVLKNCLRVF